MGKIRIMIVDDHEVVRMGLKAILEPESDFDVVGEAASGEEAITQVAAHRPGVVLMDVGMEEMTGIEACRAVKNAHPEVNVLMLTSYNEEAAVTAAIMAGVSAYLLKNVCRSELIKAIRSMAAGRNQLDPSVTRQLMEKLAQLSAREEALEVAELSQREKGVMALIAERATNGGIAERLVITENTVRNHVSRILDKLGLSRRSEAAVFAVQHGLVNQDPPTEV